MKILISQQEYVRPPRNFVFDALERSYYSFLQKHELIPFPNINKIPYNDYDCLVLTGGPDSVARHLTENLLYEHALSKGVPIIGICHGAFAINHLAGGKNDTINGHVDCDHTITMDNRIYTVNSFHTQRIYELPHDFIVLAKDTENNTEAFRHETLPIFGIVWHPERMADPVLPYAVKDILFPTI